MLPSVGCYYHACMCVCIFLNLKQSFQKGEGYIWHLVHVCIFLSAARGLPRQCLLNFDSLVLWGSITSWRVTAEDMRFAVFRTGRIRARVQIPNRWLFVPWIVDVLLACCCVIMAWTSAVWSVWVAVFKVDVTVRLYRFSLQLLILILFVSLTQTSHTDTFSPLY